VIDCPDDPLYETLISFLVDRRHLTGSKISIATNQTGAPGCQTTYLYGCRNMCV